MTDIDCHADMTAFHSDEVTLSLDQQKAMRQRRDAGRTRLKNGLDTAGHPQPREIHSQGSYKMWTMVQDPDNDYDIDDGTYFVEEDLKNGNGTALTPFEARQRVCDALKWDGRFKQEAEVKKNCVRQPYAEGHHIDVPVYRIVENEDENGDNTERFELASDSDWVVSDARAVTKWFNGAVRELNEGQTDGSQMRRVTRLTKKFARRPDWKDSTTSGITMSKLIVDHFVASPNRDDKSLRETWKAIHEALKISTEVKHPIVDKNLSEAGDVEVRFFRDCLADALEELKLLDEPDCTRAQAREAWDKVFDTDFFSGRPDPDATKKAAIGTVINVKSVETARRDDGDGRFG